MKLTELWRTKDKPTVSFELFTPPTEKAAEGLDRALPKLAAVEPDFFSVTFRAGGSGRQGSTELIERLRRETDTAVLAYFAGYGLRPEDVTATLDDFRELGVDNVLVVRGDAPPDGEGSAPHPDSLAHASDILSLVRPRYPFCLGAAGYPEGHVEAASLERDLEFVKLKADSGADFIVANYSYDTQLFVHFVERCRDLGIAQPILPGVMPIYGIKLMDNLAKLCGATITDELRARLESLPADDKKAVGRFGVDLATEQCRELLDAGAPGIHLYTLNRAKAPVEIVERLRAENLL